MQHRIDQLIRSKTLLGVLAAAVLLTVAGSTYGYAALSSRVTLSLDGQTHDVTALGDTVGDVLEAEGVTLGTHDEVAPPLDETISDGSKISVSFGRPLELSVDGVTQTHWVTATNVGAALSQIGRTYDNAELSVSRSSDLTRGGASVEVVTPKTVKIKLGGDRVVKQKLAALTVADVLEELDVAFDDDDRVQPALDEEISDGDQVVVTRIRVVTKKVDNEAIDFATVEREDDSAFVGDDTVVTAGREGLRDVTYELTYRNGELAATKVLEQRVVRKPVDQVVEVGTREEGPNFAGGSTVWDQLAQCEAGGNWAINTGNGYYGGLQFSLGTWHSYGGAGYPHQQSREYQIMIAERVRAATGGYGSWPACSRALGLPQ